MIRSRQSAKTDREKKMATPQINEQRLDAAEKILLAVLKDIRNNLSKYNHTDYMALNEAWIKLNGITLTDKTETLSRNFNELLPELLGEEIVLPTKTNGLIYND